MITSRAERDQLLRVTLAYRAESRVRQGGANRRCQGCINTFALLCNVRHYALYAKECNIRTTPSPLCTPEHASVKVDRLLEHVNDGLLVKPLCQRRQFGK